MGNKKADALRRLRGEPTRWFDDRVKQTTELAPQTFAGRSPWQNPSATVGAMLALKFVGGSAWGNRA
jgi:hypothetical protein